MLYLESSWLQAMSRASDEGLILIEGTGPTYATETVMLYACTFIFLQSFDLSVCVLYYFTEVQL
jgi:hypothetical protein